MKFSDAMEQFLLDPSEENLKPLQAAIMAAGNFDPLVAVEEFAAALLEAGDHQGLVDRLWQLMPGLFLSPTAHAMLRLCYRELGDDSAAQREDRLTQLALASLRSSGDGSQQNPYRVLRVSDEYDILRALGRKSQAQRLQPIGERSFDVHQCDEGEVWFDLLWLHRSTGASQPTAG